MPSHVSDYKNRTVSVSVKGPHNGGAYTGSFVITSRDGDAEIHQQFTPAWPKPVLTKEGAFAALKQLAEDVIDGKSDGQNVGNG